ncbi:MAG: ABC transporter ATP-binding protein [Xanthobacteraceae bacterium]
MRAEDAMAARSGSPATVPASPPLLAVEGLRKSFVGPPPLEVLGGIGFTVGEGEFVSLVGPSGCGKTTLLLALSGLQRADGGTVRFGGAAVRDATPAGMAIVFQDYSRSLLPWKTNLGNVLFGMRRVADLTTAQKKERAAELLNSVGLSGFEARYPWQLSGGMQQRVAIARGLASKSKLLLLDEPLASVDAQTRADLQDFLLAIAKQYRQTCVLVTHDVEEAIYMGDRIVVLSSRPTRVVREIAVPLPRPRDQLETRELPAFLEIRHEVLSLIRRERRENGTGGAP